MSDTKQKMAEARKLIRAMTSQPSPTAEETTTKSEQSTAQTGEELAVNFKFVGAGQAGGRMVNEFHGLGYRHTVVLNTTKSDFNGIDDAIAKYSLDVGGAAKNPSVAVQALKSRLDDVRDTLKRAWGSPGENDWVLVCAGLGGGTGSGFAAGLVQLARDMGYQKVGVLVSLPSESEGPSQSGNAVNSLAAIVRMGVSPLLVIDNARISKLFKPTMAKLYPTANMVAATSLHTFNTHAAIHSPYITFDASEFRQVLGSGCVVMGTTYIPVAELTDETVLRAKIRAALSESVLSASDLTTGDKAVCLMSVPKALLESKPAEFFEEGYTQVNSMIGSETRVSVVHRGLYESEDDDVLAIHTLIGGLQPPMDRLLQLAQAAKMPQPTRKSIGELLGL